jgi:sodium-dependent dicarboxylate transporter 2/3/5
MIRTRQEAMSAVEAYSPAEQQFNRRRSAIGAFLGPAVFVILLWLPLPLPAPAHRLSAIMSLMFVFWVTETLPVAVTALLGPTLAVLFRIVPVREAFAAFADPIIFLFMGSFMLAEAMYGHGLDRRIAYTALARPAVAKSPARILVTFGAVATTISMWISNTATAAMLFPIAMSIVTHLSASAAGNPAGVRRFALLLMLMLTFASSIGGVGTPVGTPPNLIGLGMLRSLAGIEIPFGRWMLLGVPLAIALFAALSLWFWLAGARKLTILPGSAAHVHAELERLGPVSAGERNVLLAFTLTVTLWVLPGILAILGQGNSAFAKAYAAAVPESVAAMVGALLLFVLPADRRTGQATLTWEQAVRIDWGTILLFGGGLCMGALAFSTGLAEILGRAVTGWLPVHSTFAYTAVFTALGIILSETTSNTAAASMLVPVAIAVSKVAGLPVLEPALGATLGASMGFMLPISTPPNAIAYSSGHVPITSMIRFGIVLDLVGFVIIVALISVLGPLLI